ncbi:glycosyltransferase family 4 protein [Candidatus Pacearchaeota archaeon]|nr:glycosyltransferase family 4 protein [Candidatus Pacearchaeota archaeon]
MKVLILSNLYTPNILGGAEQSAQLLAEGLLREGHEPIVVTTSNQNAIERVNGVKVYYISDLNLYWIFNHQNQKRYKKLLWHLKDIYNLKSKKEIEKIVDLEKPDIVHTNNLAGFSVSIWALSKERGIPVVHTIRDYYLLCSKSSMFKDDKICKKQCLLCKGFSFLKKYYSHRVDAVVGVSNFIVNLHKSFDYFRNAKIAQGIFNPVSMQTKASMNNHKGLRNRMLKFGFVGMISPHKGVEPILRIFKSTANAELYLFGRFDSKNYKNRLNKQFNAKNIKFMGFQKKEDIYRDIDVLIVPALWNEPFGRIIPEAYTFGIPVIASKRGGIPEIVGEGKTGFLFDPNDLNSLIDEITKFIDDPTLIYKFSNNCIKKAKDFSLETHVNSYLEIYKSLKK